MAMLAKRRSQTNRADTGALDEAFLFERSIDIETYDRDADKLREELTFASWYDTPAAL